MATKKVSRKRVVRMPDKELSKVVQEVEGRGCLVDSASVWQVFASLHLPKNEQYAWSGEALGRLTLLLLRQRGRGIYMAPGLGQSGVGKITEFDKFTDTLNDHMLVRRFTERDQARRPHVMTVTKTWAALHIRDMNQRLDKQLDDQHSNLHRWLVWSVENAWHWHSERYNGLLDLQWAPYLREILNMGDTRDVEELHRQSRDPKELTRVIQQQGKDFAHLAKAYIASAIIRGRFHRADLNGSSQKLYAHPLRNQALRKLDTNEQVLVPRATNTERYLVGIILYGSLKQRREKNRVPVWVHNICQAQKADRTLLAEKAKVSEAWKTARNIARDNNIETADRFTVSGVEKILLLVSPGLANCFLGFWAGCAAALATGYVLEKTNVVHKAVNLFELKLHEPDIQQLPGGNIFGHFD